MLEKPARSAIRLALLVGLAAGCSTGGGEPQPVVPATARSADDLLIVDCLLPGQIRKLGRKVTYLTPRQAVKTTVADCEIRGGEYAAYDRGNYAQALAIWLPEAKAGDAKAQNYVGEMYEKGLGTQPDYAAAAVWYERAAQQDYSPAQINLGQLYEQGLGVPKDVGKAVVWYRKASGLDELALEYVPGASDAQVQALRRELEQRKQETETLRRQLEQLQQELLRSRDTRSKLERDLETERGAVSGARREIEAQRAQLGDESERLARERAELERKLSKAMGEREQELREQSAALARQEQELVQRSQALEAEKARVNARESAIAEKQQEIERLDATIARLRSEAEEQRQEVARANKPRDVTLPGPSIQLIDPPLPNTRGMQSVSMAPRVRERIVVGRVEAPAGLLTLTVNDRPTKLDDNGIFQSQIPVPPEGAKVQVVAIDRLGKRNERAFELMPEGKALRAGSSQDRDDRDAGGIPWGRYHALVIGNNAYQKLPRLDTARADAEAVAKVLSERYGFEVETLYDANRYEILSKLNELRAKLNERDNLVIYYAGHGELDRVNDRGHWLPVDAEPDSTANWISNIQLTDILNAMSARHVMVVADSCYSGALTRSSLARLEAGMTSEAKSAWRKAMATKRSRTALTSGGEAPVLDSGGGQHSIFAKALLDVLQKNDDVLEGQRLFQEVSARVTWAAEERRFEQLPQYAPIKFGGHESGEFFFVPKGIAG